MLEVYQVGPSDAGGVAGTRRRQHLRWRPARWGQTVRPAQRSDLRIPGGRTAVPARSPSAPRAIGWPASPAVACIDHLGHRLAEEIGQKSYRGALISGDLTPNCSRTNPVLMRGGRVLHGRLASCPAVGGAL